MRRPCIGSLGCALLLAFAAPAQAWTVKNASNDTQLQLTDDGALGVGEKHPASKLHVVGAIQVANDTGACNTAKAGAIRWSGTAFEGCNGQGAWIAFTGGGNVPPSPAGQPTIDLGSYGKLILPTQVDGKWYYYWDRSGDGSKADSGSLNGGVDCTSMNVLKTLFDNDANGYKSCGVGVVNNTCRYATLNGVKVILPTSGTGRTSEPSGYYYLPDNQTYTDLAAIWDVKNSGGWTPGIPSGWQYSYYWSATPSVSGHAAVLLQGGGSVYDHGDGLIDSHSVALQVP